ncbi:putative alpha,alpha-trehalose-phosphate synthase (UDP-forming), Trehalose-phosphatase [Helianthus annuus]|nr:putative alpha,alpha-trehalose-phosphate synthase (UDP-forming), Trehalose-phosphatase [Helianthus annuus]
MERIVSAYKQTTRRAILLDYDGTLMPQSSIDKSPSSKTVEMLNTLCRDKNNMVFVVSARSRNMLSEWFASCEKLGLAAEHGCFLRLKRDEEWETCVQVEDSGWKQNAHPIMTLYTETTDGSMIETKDTSMVWSYEDADPDFGSCQAKELLDHLESVLANEPVTVKREKSCVEIKPQGVSKGLVVKRLLANMHERGTTPDFVLCIGDDRSDEDMFEVITSSVASDKCIAPNAEVFACTVGNKPSKAKYYLDDTVEIARMMQGLALVSEKPC